MKEILKKHVRPALYRLAYAAERLAAMPEHDVRRMLEPARGLRFCVVKQDVYNDLYCCPYGVPFRELIASSLKRSGPVALFSEFGADFRMIKTVETPECDIWQQKWYDCRQRKLEDYRALQVNANPFGENQHQGGQARYAVDADSVDWSQYDVVLSLDVAIPAAVTGRFPGTVWAYWISEPCMGAYSASRKSPVTGYDLFLNQRFWARGLFPNREHEIDFPYAFLNAGCMRDLAGDEARSGVMVESHTKHLLSSHEVKALERFGPVRFIGGTITDIIKGLHASRYWVRLGGRVLWGNGMAEAVACGCLALGNPGEFKNRSLFTTGTIARSFAEALERIAFFEGDAAARDRELATQKARLEYYCYARPMRQLAERALEIRARRSMLKP